MDILARDSTSCLLFLYMSSFASPRRRLAAMTRLTLSLSYHHHPPPHLDTTVAMSQETLSQTLMSFTPIKQIHSHFHAVHCYATGQSHPRSARHGVATATDFLCLAADHTRGVPAHHFCSHSSSRNLRQCIVYDSDQPDARLIGIEYIIDRDTFARLPEDEKKYWHSREFMKQNQREQKLTPPRSASQTRLKSRVESCRS